MEDDDIDITRLSKYMTWILRHHAKVIGIKVDIHGWSDVPRWIYLLSVRQWSVADKDGSCTVLEATGMMSTRGIVYLY